MNRPALPIASSDSDLGDRSAGSLYAQLSRDIKQAGLLHRRGGVYAARIGAVVVLLAGTWTAFALIGSSWWQMFTAVLLAGLFTQVGFLGHDAGHRQIFRSKRLNDLIGMLHANLGIGLSYGWWINKHNRHHANPNTEGRDPDILVQPLAFSDGQAARQRGLRRLLIRLQGYLFVPLLTLEALSLHAASVTRHVPARPEATPRRDRSAHRPRGAVPDRGLPGADPGPGGRLRHHPSGPVRHLPGQLVRAQPQGHADPGQGQRVWTTCGGRC